MEDSETEEQNCSAGVASPDNVISTPDKNNLLDK